MAQQEEIVLWIDQRWKRAIEKHLKGETLQEHLENVLDELCNQLPQREYERISRAIQSEAAAQRAEEEAARTYAAYHVTERGKEWYFKTRPVRSCWRSGKSCAVTSPARKLLCRICLSKCLQAVVPSLRRNTMR